MKISTVLKWVGFATAILSLIAGIRELNKVFADRIEAGRKVASLLASERLQLRARDYASAWRSLDQASQVNADSAEIHTAQEAVAMEWLENATAKEGESLSDIAVKLEPVLTRGVAASLQPVHQADLLAHIGWSYFLRSREGASGFDPSGNYADAVNRDPSNPYAQAMWGHWILWNKRDPAEAAPHFSAALASHRERAFVRHLQLAALLNGRNSACDQELVRVLNAIRLEQGTVDADTKRAVFNVYDTEIMPSDDETRSFVDAVSTLDHLATFQWLFDDRSPDESEALPRLCYLSVLQEAAGQRTEALAGYKELRSKLNGRTGALLKVADAGIKRLSS